MDRLIRRRTLCALLDITPEITVQWNRTGLLRVDRMMGSEAHYRESEIDRFLARDVRNGETVTFAELASGKVILISSAEAASQLDMSRQRLRKQIDQGYVHAVRIGNKKWRVTQASLDAYRARLEYMQYDLAAVRHILGVTAKTVRTAARGGKLVYGTRPGTHQLFVAPGSLVAYVEERLPAWAKGTAQAWIDERLDTPRPLLSQVQAAENLKLTYEVFTALVDPERIGYINHPGGHRRLISPQALDVYQGLESAVPLAEVARWYGVHRSSIHNWMKRGLLHCPIGGHTHDPDDLQLTLACWTGIIEPLLSPGQSARMWIFYRRRYQNRYISFAEALRTLEIYPKELGKLIETGSLPAIRTPVGEWRLSGNRVSRL
jgi:predicted site-specific integrase-resolvase